MKPLLGNVNKALPLPLPLLYHLHRVEDDATNRVTFDYCEIAHKNISSSNSVKKRQHWSGDLLVSASEHKLVFAALFPPFCLL